MKTFISCLLIFALNLPSAKAGEILQFSGRIQDENLAEEAIDLLQCVADRLDLSWELSEGAGAGHSLRLKETNGRLQGTFRSPRGEKPVTLELGRALAVCQELAPEEPSVLAPNPLPSLEGEVEAPRKKNTWLWVGAAVAIAVGGFLFLKSRPDHRSLSMQ